MAFVETGNLKTKDKKGSFLGDVLATVGPMALGALGSIASGGMSQIGGGLVSSILGGGNESTEAMGGNIPQMTKYASGGSHEQNGLGGIPVDSLGNPSGNPSALVEQGEVGYKLPNDQTGYVFSNRIKVPGKKHTFADEAKRTAARYKNRLGENLDKPDSLAKRALDMAMNTLKDNQEAVKQQEQEAMAVKAMGGYINALATGGPIETKSGKKLKNFDYKTFDPNFPVFELGADETLPTLPKKEGGVRHGGNTSTYEAIAKSINNPEIRDAAIISSVGNYLTRFMDEDAVSSLDSLYGSRKATGDTTGMSADIEALAKRFPSAYVDPKEHLSPEAYQTYMGALERKFGKSASALSTGNYANMFGQGRNVSGAYDTEETLGKAKYGLRSRAATPTFVSNNREERQIVNSRGVQTPYSGTYEVPVEWDHTTGNFKAGVSNLKLDQEVPKNFNYARMEPLKANETVDPYEQLPTSQIQRFKAYGGGLPKYTPGGDLPNQDRENYLKYHSGLPEAYIGYGLQAATRIPQLFTKPESIHYDRVNPETIDLAQERGSMETSRNNQLGFLKRQAGMAGSAGQALNYLSSVVPQAYNQYDQQYAQSIEREQNANAQIMNQANAQNAQIQMREAEANAMERDAARGIRDQALADIGKTGLGALTAKKSALEQYNALKMQGMINDFDFAFDQNGVRITRDGRKENVAEANPTTPVGNSITNSIGYNPYKATANLPELGNTLQNNSPYLGKSIVPKLNTIPLEEFQENPEMMNYLNKLLSHQGNPSTEGVPQEKLKGTYACGGSLKKCKGGYLKKKGRK